jgi:hypothetical protein
MTTPHSYNIEKLKADFENIFLLKMEITKTKTKIADKLNQLKAVYTNLLQSNTKKIFLFCLDSFYFQYKSFAMEIDNIDRFRVLLNNRMYCDYYKLHNIIIQDIKEQYGEIDVEELITKSYPVYKDLEPFQEYKMDDIKDIHNNILSILNEMYGHYDKKGDNIDHYNENHRIGFSISNFINTLNHDNKMLKEKIDLYVNYVSFFHIAQKKQLKRLSLRINEFYKEVDDNININRTFSINDIADEQRLNRFYMTDSGDELAIHSIYEDMDLGGGLKTPPLENTLVPEVAPVPIIDLSGGETHIDTAATVAEVPGDNLLDFEFPTLTLQPLGSKKEDGETTTGIRMNSDFTGTVLP